MNGSEDAAAAAARPRLRRLPSGFWVLADSGEAVSHPVLRNLPFAHSAEPWVRAHFPDADYAAIDAAEMQPLDLRAPGVLVLQGPKGLGKSKAIRAAVAQLPASTSAVQITFRRSLAWSSAELLGAAASVYSALPTGAISARQHPRLTIVVNSVARIRGRYDVVVIDEVVSVLDMLAGALLAPASRSAIVNTLQWLIGGARTVVLADAMLDVACVDFVMRCRGSAEAVAAIAAGPRSAAPPLRVLDYVRRLHTDYTYVAHASHATWMSALMLAVCGGQRVVVPCMTKTMAEAVAAQFSRIVPTLLYTADSHGASLAEHMSAIDVHWSTAQLLVFSPVITAGCSFERRHFDVAFFYGVAGIGAVRSAVQMIARVRDLSTRTVHVVLTRADATFAPLPAGDLDLAVAPTQRRVPCVPCAAFDAASTAPDDAMSDEEDNDDDAPAHPSHADVHLQLLQLLDACRTREARICERAFAFHFWTLVAHAGPRITFPRADAVDDDDLAAAAAEHEVAVASTAVAATAANAQPVATESPFAHDWDAGFLAPLPTHATACAACFDARGARVTLLQRATVCGPLALAGELPHVPHGAVTWRSLHTNTDGDAGGEPPPQETRSRLRVWSALLVSCALMPVAPSKRVEVLPATGVPWASPRVAGAMAAAAEAGATTVVRFLPPLPSGADADARARLSGAHTTILDVVLDAWALTAARDGDERVRLPHGQLPALLQRAEAAQRALCTVKHIAHVMVNVPVGRGAAGAGSVDVVGITGGRAVHLFALRQDVTRARAAGVVALDVLKLRCLAHAAGITPPFQLAALHVVYADAVVHVDGTAGAVAPVNALTLQPCREAVARALAARCGFAVVQRAKDGHLRARVQLPGMDAPLEHDGDAAAMQDALHACASRCATLFTWGTRVVSDADGLAVNVADVERVIATLLFGSTTAAVPLEDVHCHRGSTHTGQGPLPRLVALVTAVYDTRFVVAVAEGRPVSVELSHVPTAAWLAGLT
jgi:hypothetical protein